MPTVQGRCNCLLTPVLHSELPHSHSGSGASGRNFKRLEDCSSCRMNTGRKNVAAESGRVAGASSPSWTLAEASPPSCMFAEANLPDEVPFKLVEGFEPPNRQLARASLPAEQKARLMNEPCARITQYACLWMLDLSTSLPNMAVCLNLLGVFGPPYHLLAAASLPNRPLAGVRPPMDRESATSSVCHQSPNRVGSLQLQKSRELLDRMESGRKIAAGSLNRWKPAA